MPLAETDREDCIAFPPCFEDFLGLYGGRIGLIVTPRNRAGLKAPIVQAPCCLRHLELLERRIQDPAHGFQIVEE